MKPVMLATDLDDTLIGDDAAMRRLNMLVDELRKTADLRLVYVTGRSPKMVAELQGEKSLLTPDALITSIGTEISINDELVTTWPSPSWWDIDELRKTLSQYSELELQPSVAQRAHKLSYFLDDNPVLASEIQKVLSGYAVDVVYSMGRYLDVLPRGVNKGSSIKFLSDIWGVSPDSIFTSGDSLNDASLLSVGRGIIVGNAKQELVDWARNTGAEVYVARDGYAAGIIEGLQYYGLLISSRPVS